MDLFDKKRGYYVNYFWYLVSAILNDVLHVKQIIIPKIMVVWHFKTKFNVELNMGDLTSLFEIVRTLKSRDSRITCKQQNEALQAI